MSSSSSIQFKSYLCNQVCDIAGNEVSPTKQARGDSSKERLGYVRNPRSMMEGTETLCRNDIGIYLEAPNISD